ncbi:uncharacterized protein [Diabrotica undecimpunctata]|uniref:uncharacterized protein n=1 Tax=Diabrotica undecimpunctata TaxID=50387 RepID=UPI003B63272D
MSQMATNEKTMIEELLKCYKTSRCLWDVQCETYSNRDRRNEAYNSLLEIFKTAYPDATLAILKKKLENLRTGYKREEKKVISSEACGTSQIYVPKLWYYNLMSFLNEKPSVSWKVEMLEEEDEETTESRRSDTGDEQPPSTSQPTPPEPPRKKKRTNLERKKEPMIDAAQTLLSTQENEWDIIGRSYGLQLQKLEPTQQAIAEKLFAEVIFYGKMKQLTPSSTINLIPTIENAHFQYHFHPQFSSHLTTSSPSSSIHRRALSTPSPRPQEPSSPSYATSKETSQVTEQLSQHSNLQQHNKQFPPY